jgi:hypothetical protein
VTIYDVMTVWILKGTGVCFRRETWNGHLEKAAIYPKNDGIIFFRRHPQDQGWEWKPKTADLAAEDWVVCK